jgi:hypothetical protein
MQNIVLWEEINMTINWMTEEHSFMIKNKHVKWDPKGDKVKMWDEN